MRNRFRLEQIQEFYINPSSAQHDKMPIWNNTTRIFDWIAFDPPATHTHPYEPVITKTTGYAKIVGGLWTFDNSTFQDYVTPSTNENVMVSNGTIWTSGSVPGRHLPVTLATNHGLSLSTQTLALGTPSTITSTSTNSVTTTTHTHAITPSLVLIGNGSAINQIPLTGTTPFTPTWTTITNLVSLNNLSFASTAFVKMTAANTFTLDTNVYVIKSGDTGLGNMYFVNNSVIDVVSTVDSDVLNIGTTNADIINIGYASSTVNINGTVSYQYATDLKVVDKLITLNVGGGIASGVSTGFEVEENAIVTGWFTTSGARTGFELRAPATSYSAIFLLSSLAAERTYTFPNVSGTVALTSDLTGFATKALDNLASVAMNASLQWDNTADRTFDIAPTANTVVGRALTISAGSTVTAGTANMAGGNLTLNSGLGKGTGASSIIFQTGRTLTTGSTLQTLTTAMTILGNGNVGIGTTGPTTLLHIKGTDPYLTIDSTNWNKKMQLGVTSSGGYGAIIPTSEGFGIFNNAGSTFNLFITNTGNVGIGTTTPGLNKLSVSTTGNSNALNVVDATGNVLIGTATDVTAYGGAKLQVKSSGSTATTWYGRIISGGDVKVFLMGQIDSKAVLAAHNAALSAWADMHISPSSGSNTYIGNTAVYGASNLSTTVLSVLGSGNVGIGTTGPLSKLSINGGLHVGGDSDAGDNNAIIDGTLLVSGVASSLTANPGTSTTQLATTEFVQVAVRSSPGKEASEYATIAALPTVVYNNGTAGVGATLTGVGLGAITLDGNTPIVGNRLLVKNQVSTFQNGVYSVTIVGTAGTVFVLTRALDFNQQTDVLTGAATYVVGGTTLAGTTWDVNSADSPVIGTDAITFVQSAGPGSVVQGNGITITGTSIAINTAVTVDLSTAQTLTNKTIDGVTPTVMGYLDATSSIQTQLNNKQDAVAPGANGNVLTSNGTVWVSSAPGGGGSTGAPSVGGILYLHANYGGF